MSRKSTSEEGLSPLERGRARYRRKDYSGALEAFNQAVRQSTEFLLLNALDHRAAALEKLERLPLALKDSKRMIDLKPELAKGYLRCGKILELKGECDLALKIYERGLSKVKIGTDVQRLLLQLVFNKLRKAQGVGNDFDPLKRLPLEVVFMICGYLSMRDRTVCLAVTRKWKTLLESMHQLWTTLDTTSARKAISTKSLRAYLKRSNFSLDQAIITPKAQFTPSQMAYLTEKCKSLRILNILGSSVIGHGLTDSIPFAKNLQYLTVSRDCPIGFTTAVLLLQTARKSLKGASFLNIGHTPFRGTFGDHKFEVLESIELGSRDGGCIPFESLQKLTPNLKSLVLDGFIQDALLDATPWKHLEHLSFIEMTLDRVPMLPPSLKRLVLDDNYKMDIDQTGEEEEFNQWEEEEFDQTEEEEFDQTEEEELDQTEEEEIDQTEEEEFDQTGKEEFNLPLLEFLSVRKCNRLSSAGLWALTLKSIENGNLKELDVSEDYWDHGIPANKFYPASESLEELSFHTKCVDDKNIMGVCDLYPNLVRLDVHSTSFTGVGMRYVVEKGIKYVDARKCEYLSEDAVHWARQQGVEVEWDNAYKPPRQLAKWRERIAIAYAGNQISGI